MNAQIDSARSDPKDLYLHPIALVRRFPLLSFMVLACFFGWNPYIRMFLTGGSGAENFPLGPLLATLVVVSCQGRDQLRRFGRQVRNWRAKPSWYALAVLAPLTFQLLIVLANHQWWGAPMPTAAQLADWPQVLVTFVTMLVFVGIGEETGWILFAAPILLRRHSLLVAWVFAASMRIFWHLPMMIDGNLPWVLGIVGNAAFTMVMLQLLLASNGRWSLIAVWHATLNAVGGPFFFAIVSGEDRARLGYLLAGIYSVVAIAVHFAGGPHLTLSDDLTRHVDQAPGNASPTEPAPAALSTVAQRATTSAPEGD